MNSQKETEKEVMERVRKKESRINKTKQNKRGGGKQEQTHTKRYPICLLA